MSLTITADVKREAGVTITVEADGSMRRRVNAPKPEKIKATPEAREALRRQRQEELEMREKLEIIMREETRQLRITRKGEEYERVETVRTASVKTTRRRVGFVVLETDGHKREIRKVKTTASKLEKDGKLTRDLANYLSAFARSVADGMGVATDDGHDSTNRLTASYEPIGTLSGFGSRTPSDRQLLGIEALQEMKNRVPNELIPIFNQIVDEEVAGYSPLARTLSELGERLGYKHKQQTAAGGALVYAVSCLIAHYMRERGIFSKDVRQVDALET